MNGLKYTIEIFKPDIETFFYIKEISLVEKLGFLEIWIHYRDKNIIFLDKPISSRSYDHTVVLYSNKKDKILRMEKQLCIH